MVYDMHAEVLAKKGFMLFLKNFLAQHDNVFESESNCLSIHCYVSSAPCGNSVIKKWARPTLGRNFGNLPDHAWPSPNEEKFHYTAKHEGQGCLLVKECSMPTDNDINILLKFEMPKATQLWSVSQTLKYNICTDADLTRSSDKKSSNDPAKQVPLKPSLTCSDKILFWQHLGLQGSELLKTRFFQKPLHLSTITVGRKYSEPHLCRALFGRYKPSKAMLGKGAPKQQPITCLVTSLKLDESVYCGEAESENASFADPRCYWWCQLGSLNIFKSNADVVNDEKELFEILDGKTGKTWGSNYPSEISPDLISENLKDIVLTSNKQISSPYSVIDYKNYKNNMFEFFQTVTPTDLKVMKL